MTAPQKSTVYISKTALFASILLLVMGQGGHVVAAEDEYSIENVKVDSDGKDTEDARTKALSEGEMDAFRQFINRRNPQKAGDIITKMPSAEMSRVISGFEIVEEKITPNHYHATLRYNFSPEAVTDVLPPSEAPVQKAPIEDTSKSKAVLIIPVLKEGGVVKLWQDDNKWRSIWYESALESGNGIVVMPLGGMDDRVDITEANVETATTDTLKRMYDRYAVSEIYVLYAYFNKKADPKPTLEVTLKRIASGKEETSHMDYIIRSTEDEDALMVRASNDIAQHLYKLQTINPDKIEYDRLKEITARVQAGDIQEWENLRKRLLTHGNIVGIKITSVSFYGTQMVITFRGTPDMLGKTLVASGLRVMQDGDNLLLMLK